MTHSKLPWRIVNTKALAKAKEQIRELTAALEFC